MLSLFGRRKDRIEQRDELLSAYLDGELSKRESERLEARLSEDVALRAELRAMHRTVSMMRDLPEVAAPQNFILSESMVEGRQPAPTGRRVRPEAQSGARAWAAPLLTAAATVVSLLFVVVVMGDVLLPGVGGLASAPAPVRQAEEAPKAALEAAPTREVVEAYGTADIASPPPAATAAAPQESAEESERAVQEEGDAGEATRAAATRAAQAPPGLGGGSAPPVVTSSEDVTPTIPAEPPVVSEDELGLVESTPGALEVTPELLPEGRDAGGLGRPPVSWRVLEVALGLASLVLGVAAVQAWRLRRR